MCECSSTNHCERPEDRFRLEYDALQSALMFWRLQCLRNYQSQGHRLLVQIRAHYEVLTDFWWDCSP